MSSRFNAAEADRRWQARWDEAQCFRADSDSNKPKAYVLEMFPYPSGRIHMGHVRNYTMGDVLARYRRMQGMEVLHPMGWDAFGMPAENAAMERKVHPGEWTWANIRAMREQLKSIGFALDWSRELATCDPAYYGHEQALFLDLFEAGLVYRKESEVNWDPVDMTVLANEQVIDGKGWRSGATVERRKLAQWFLKITDFADDLLEGLADARPVARQGPADAGELDRQEPRPAVPLPACRSAVGAIDSVEVFTTRPDTIFGASFVAVAADHPIAQAVAASDPKAAAFIAECKAGGTSAAEVETAEKKGFRTGVEVVHPLDPEWRLPLYIANFVLMDYGTGAIFGVPGHDQRDFEFATQYHLADPARGRAERGRRSEPIGDEAETAPGVAVNSRFLDGLTTEQATAEVIRRAEAAGWGHGTVQYRLRDWGVSRQRYWGTPIPIIHCAQCGAVPVPREQLPVVLPDDIEFDKPGNPLDRHPTLEACRLPELRRRGDARDRHARHLRRFELVLHPLRQPAGGPAVRPRRGREMAAGRPIYRRGRACDPAPALRALLDPRAEAARADLDRRAVQGPVHARHGDARDLSRRRRQLAQPRRGQARTATTGCTSRAAIR